MKIILDAWTIHAPYCNWDGVTETSSGWYENGVYHSPLGMCLIYRQDDYARISTIVHGRMYRQSFHVTMTQRQLAIRSGKFLKELINNSYYLPDKNE